jgi:hypothetical protein
MSGRTPELEKPNQTMIDAINRGDTATFLSAFADDAVLFRVDGRSIKRLVIS